jgi:membrane protease YdiL (CAAX protease family)
MDWLRDEAKGANLIWYVIFAGITVVSLDYAVENALINWQVIPAPDLPKVGDTPFKYWNAFQFISMFIWAPVKEEIIFRVLPLSIVIAFVRKSPGFVFGAMVIFAGLFGAIHPYSAGGEILVAISGFFFGLVFLKCGGLNENFVKASICAMAAHGVTNVLIVLDAWWRYFETAI